MWGEVKPKNIDNETCQQVKDTLYSFVEGLTLKHNYQYNNILHDMLCKNPNRCLHEGIILFNGVPDIDNVYNVFVCDSSDSSAGMSMWDVRLYAFEEWVGKAMINQFSLEHAVNMCKSARFEFNDRVNCKNDIKIVERTGCFEFLKELKHEKI